MGNRHTSKYVQSANKHMKRCLMSLIIEKCKSKPPWDTTSHPLGWLLSKNRNNKCWQGYEVGILVHRWWGYKMVQLPWKTVRQFFKKLKIKLPYDPEIPLLGIYPKIIESRVWRDIHTSMFTAALFTIAKRRRQSKCLLMDDWINKIWCIVCMMEYHSTLEKKEMLSYATT